MKVLITGSSGFVGHNLLKYLEENDFTLNCINRRQLNDINSDTITDSDSIVHLAGKAHDLKKTSNPDEYYEINFELTKALYDSFLESKAKKFIFISSVKAVADSVQGWLDEEEVPNPQTHYGKSKQMAETYIQMQPLPLGKSFYILRPCMIHGPGNKGNLNLLYQFVKKGIPYPLAAFKNKRSFLSVKNLCFVIQRLLETDIPSGIYNVADDDALSTNEVVSILAEASEKRPKLLHIPVKILGLSAKLGDFLKLPLNTERLQKLTENYCVSNQKIKQALHVQLPLSTREGLTLTAKSFNDN
ncbi:NAD-dependent epimerase/dehydratase family protein [Pedobacter frigiditerrae]|uniref:NAD-dependent epimerase/dehydratase family protein n=1 Tax=Pedobacter frigiditerrae TaxID=2530452 RepID=A0A4R0N461_9SPHI|nr:NAD-dependent epimerase/dehydratase family protein [Pedobacter frigiditerrae]TCC94163.1 NAD-dependent epimerase/dehydratase family protein [Pedobacter frigiditerrae]